MRVCRLSLAILIAGLLLCTAACASSTAEAVPNGSWDEDIGYAYFKGFTEDDVAYDGAGIYYVKNQILLQAGNKLTFKDVSEIASQYNAEIVGYLEMGNSYQIEIRTDVTLEELNRTIDELNENPEISLASLNPVSAVQAEGDGSDTKTYYRTPKEPISLEGYEPYAILYITSGGVYDGGNVSGVIVYADGRAVHFSCPPDLYSNNLNMEKLFSDPESQGEVTSLQSPDMETIDNIFTLQKDIDPNAQTRITEKIQTSNVTTEELYMDYDLLCYFRNSDGEYQRLLLDAKGESFYSLVDSNAEKISTWFFEQQSTWGFEVYEP